MNRQTPAPAAGSASVGRCAWIDESVPDPRWDPNIYLLAASVVARPSLEAVRAAMLGLQSGFGLVSRKVHWRDSDAGRRQKITETIAGMAEMVHTVVVLDGIPDQRPERRRRMCMERLLFELEVQDVTAVTFEARADKQNRDDRAMVDGLRARKVITSALRVEHVPGPVEPALWVPDAVCGAVTAARRGQGTYLDVLRGKLTLVEIAGR